MTRMTQHLFIFLFFWFALILPSVAAQHGIAALPAHINTPDPNVAPLRYADKLFFTSIAQKDKTSAPQSRMLSSRLAGGAAQILNENPTGEGRYAANMALMPDASRMYYSICADGEINSQNQCAIWYREKSYEGGWGPAIKLPAHINHKDYPSTQPSIGFDKRLKKFVLYFVSNRPGGRGGFDIWASEMEHGGTFGHPYNLPMNTPGDEVTPYFHAASQQLFFSSNGLFGIGGFDIFQTEKTSATDWQTPENLGELVNSWDDELYFTYHLLSRKGYFASNRPHALGDKEKSRLDYDIYEMDAVIEIELLALDEDTSIPISGIMAEVWQKGVERPLVFREQPFDEGLWMQLEGGRQYHIIIRAKGYSPLALELDSEGLIASMSMRRKVYLRAEKADGDGIQRRRISKPARFLNTSPTSVMELRGKHKTEDLLGLPF